MKKENKNLKKVIKQIRKLAEEVYGELGSGFDERVYQRAMEAGLRLAKVRYENQKVVELKFKDHYVGEGYPDLVVNLNGIKLVLELKAIAGKTNDILKEDDVVKITAIDLDEI